MSHLHWHGGDDTDSMSVEDPANGNNDLKPFLDSARLQLCTVASSTLATIEWQGWEGVFGKVEGEAGSQKTSAIVTAAAAVSRPTRPWCSKM